MEGVRLVGVVCFAVASKEAASSRDIASHDKVKLK
jgi:hypothetical protein